MPDTRYNRNNETVSAAFICSHRHNGKAGGACKCGDETTG
jgi:hypothetical protein